MEVQHHHHHHIHWGGEADCTPLLDRLETLMADFTQEIDAKLGALGDALTASTTAIKTEIDNLKAQGVDVSAIEAHIDNLTAVAQGLPAAVDAAQSADPGAPADPSVPGVPGTGDTTGGEPAPA